MREKEKAFSDIVQRYKNTIFTVCYLFSKDQDEANDLFQETLINLWRGFDGFQGKCDVKTWIWRVSFNTSSLSLCVASSPSSYGLPITLAMCV